MDELILEIEENTGFVCYENANMVKTQYTFYGTSDMFEDFKDLVEDKFDTGTLVYFIDTKQTRMYSRFKETWY